MNAEEAKSTTPGIVALGCNTGEREVYKYVQVKKHRTTNVGR